MTRTQRGFTLIEVMIATMVLTVGVLGTYALVSRVITATSVSVSQLTASYLAQEGLELVRNARDTNFLRIRQGEEIEWTDGLLSCSAGCEVDYNDAAFDSYQGRFLKATGSFYAYDSGEDTKFKREVTITQPSANALEIFVDVSWQDRGNISREVQAADKLYNWYTP